MLNLQEKDGLSSMTSLKKRLSQILLYAIEKGVQAGALVDDRRLTTDHRLSLELETPKNPEHGDFSANIAMVMASSQGQPPRKIAQIIINQIVDTDKILQKIEVAGPGFINFVIANNYWQDTLKQIQSKQDNYGASDHGKGKRVLMEFVSANPTGPLHVGHGRGAAVGDTLCNILKFSGYHVEKEYYINDSGRQIKTLGLSVFLRYQELWGGKVEFPSDCYQGEYIRGIAKTIAEKDGKRLLDLPEQEGISFCAKLASSVILEEIKEDLKDFGVTFDQWFSEQSLFDAGEVDRFIEQFQTKGKIYSKEGALWFRTTEHGDEKDRVVLRANNAMTYFASDIAYHAHKLNRNFDLLIDIWGADHHGYIPRVHACIEALGYNKERLKIILINLVNLLRGGKIVAMSTRSGEFVPLRVVIDEVGKDPARFMFLTRRADSPLDFDLELAKKKSNDNPVYYVQYVHARISSILKKAQEAGISNLKSQLPIDLTLLSEPEEISLMKCLERFPEIVSESAKFMEPHRIPVFLTELATAFHIYYNRHRVITDRPDLTIARLYLNETVRIVVKNGLVLAGVSAPETM
ncbi:MAG: arginine--tRNA ligase [Pseudomonadota bacterium]